MALTREQLIRLARLGAKKRLAELDEERRSILALVKGNADGDRRQEKSGGRRKTRGWTPAQRKAAAARMKAYWAKKKT